MNINLNDHKCPVLLKRKLRVTHGKVTQQVAELVWAPGLTPHQCWSNVTSERLASWEAVSCLEEVTPLHWKHTKQRNEWHWEELGTVWLTPSLYSHFASPGNPLRPSKTYIHTAPSLRWEAGREGEMPAFCRQRQGTEPGPAQETRAASQLGPS